MDRTTMAVRAKRVNFCCDVDDAILSLAMVQIL